MKLKWEILILITLFLFVNHLVGTSQNSKESKTYIDTLIVDEHFRLSFVKAQIQGNTYKLLVDTGAPFVLFEKHKKEIKLKHKRRSKVADSNNTLSKVISGFADEIVIGSQTYNNVRMIIMEVQGPIIKCLDFDGIIGANIMANAIWQFDKENGQILVTNKLSSILPDTNTRLSMTLNGWQKSPFIKVRLSGTKRFNALFDTGYSQLFTLDQETADKFLPREDSMNYTKFFGFGSEGAFGRKLETTVYYQSDSLYIDKFIYTPSVYSVNKDDHSKVGSEFLDDRIVTLDFGNRHMYIHSEKVLDSLLPQTFGFSPNMENGRIVVGTIERNHPLSKKISVGDEVIQAGNLVLSQGCSDFLKVYDLMEKNDTLKFRIRTKNGEVIFEQKKRSIL